MASFRGFVICQFWLDQCRTAPLFVTTEKLIYLVLTFASYRSLVLNSVCPNGQLPPLLYPLCSISDCALASCSAHLDIGSPFWVRDVKKFTGVSGSCNIRKPSPYLRLSSLIPQHRSLLAPVAFYPVWYSQSQNACLDHLRAGRTFNLQRFRGLFLSFLLASEYRFPATTTRVPDKRQPQASVAMSAEAAAFDMPSDAAAPCGLPR